MKFVPLVVFLLALVRLGAEYHELEATDGRTISAKILSAGETEARVQRKDGYEFTIGYNRLSERSREFLVARAIAKRIRESRDFSIGFSKKRIERTDKVFDFHGLEISTYTKKLSIRKPDRLDIDGLELKYVLLIDRAATNKLPPLVKGSEIIIDSEGAPELEFETPSYALHRMYLLPNHWWDREKSEYEDEEKGIWARLFYKDQLVYEESSPNRFMEKNDWRKLVKPAVDPFANKQTKGTDR